MKKREVKAFDIKEFKTVEELKAEIDRLQALDKKQEQRLKIANKVLFVPFVTGIVASVLALLFALEQQLLVLVRFQKWKTLPNLFLIWMDLRKFKRKIYLPL